MAGTSSSTAKGKEIMVDVDVTNSEVSICAVPRVLRNSNRDAFTPQVISIGPFHWGEVELFEMEILKKEYQNAFKESIGDKQFEKIENEIKKMETSVKECYQQTSKIRELINNNQFLDIILLDCFFIVELFIRNQQIVSGIKLKDKLFQEVWIVDAVRRDFLLLENQVPYFLLQMIYQLSNIKLNLIPEPKNDEDEEYGLNNKEFLVLTSRFLHIGNPNRIVQIEIKHFCDFIRLSLARFDVAKKVITYSKPYPPQKMPRHVHQMPRVVELDRAGLKFEIGGGWATNLKTEKRRSGKSLLKNLVLQIPPITISNTTEPLLLNVMALEQCFYPSETHVCNYVFFMDSIIDNEDDVRLLVQKKILTNELGHDSEVARLFNRSSLHITRSDSIFFGLSEELKLFYSNSFNKIKANLKKYYFDHFWVGFATVCGFIMMIMAVLRTGFTVLSYFQEK